MAERPRVSVLVPVFNRASLVGGCVRSALEQTVADLEVVVVDNHSTDGTWEVCQRLARQDPRVRAFRNPSNLGPVRNWARCMEEARGTCGKILFSDDLMRADFLERTLPLLDDPQVGFVFTAAEVGPAPGAGLPAFRWRPGTGAYASHRFVTAELFCQDVPVSPGAALFRMEDLRKGLMLQVPSPTMSDFAEHGAGPDLLLYLLTAQRYPKVGFVADAVTFFRLHPGSITMGSRNAYLHMRYVQAKLWFALHAGPPSARPPEREVRRFLAREWLKACLREARLISRRDFLGRLLDAEHPLPSTGSVAWAAAHLARQGAAGVMRRLGSVGRGQRQAPRGFPGPRRAGQAGSPGEQLTAVAAGPREAG